MPGYKIELHAHSKESSRCGKVKAEKVVELYKESGYQVIVMTDHYYQSFFKQFPDLCWEEKIDNYLRGYYLAREKGEKVGVKVLLGIEITFLENNNDYLIYGLNEEILRSLPELYRYSLREFKELLSGEDILIFQAHPYRGDNRPASVELLAGLEVHNGNLRHDNKNHLAYDFARKNKLKMISGSDFHQEEDLARGGIIVPHQISNMAQLLEVLKSDNYNIIGENVSSHTN